MALVRWRETANSSFPLEILGVTNEEKRRDPRRALRTLAMVQSPQHGSVKVETVDLSVGGLCIQSPVQMALGEMCTLYFILPIAGGERRNITAVAKVAYSRCSGMDGFKTGFEFKQIDQTSKGTIIWYCTQ